MYDGIRAYGGIRNPGATIAIAYFIILVIVGNCILIVKCNTVFAHGRVPSRGYIAVTEVVK